MPLPTLHGHKPPGVVAPVGLSLELRMKVGASNLAHEIPTALLQLQDASGYVGRSRVLRDHGVSPGHVIGVGCTPESEHDEAPEDAGGNPSLSHRQVLHPTEGRVERSTLACLSLRLSNTLLPDDVCRVPGSASLAWPFRARFPCEPLAQFQCQDLCARGRPCGLPLTTVTVSSV